MKTFNNLISNRMINGIGMASIVAVTAFSMNGCATIPPPTEQMAVSKAEVTTAVRDGGNEFAPLETKSAMEKMDAAERAMAEKEHITARRLAEQAQLDAKLAEVKTTLAKTQKSVDESRESNRILREEINRTTK